MGNRRGASAVLIFLATCLTYEVRADFSCDASKVLSFVSGNSDPTLEDESTPPVRYKLEKRHNFHGGTLWFGFCESTYEPRVGELFSFWENKGNDTGYIKIDDLSCMHSMTLEGSLLTIGHDHCDRFAETGAWSKSVYAWDPKNQRFLAKDVIHYSPLEAKAKSIRKLFLDGEIEQGKKALSESSFVPEHGHTSYPSVKASSFYEPYLLGTQRAAMAANKSGDVKRVARLVQEFFFGNGICWPTRELVPSLDYEICWDYARAMLADAHDGEYGEFHQILEKHADKVLDLAQLLRDVEVASPVWARLRATQALLRKGELEAAKAAIKTLRTTQSVDGWSADIALADHLYPAYFNGVHTAAFAAYKKGRVQEAAEHALEFFTQQDELCWHGRFPYYDERSADKERLQCWSYEKYQEDSHRPFLGPYQLLADADRDANIVDMRVVMEQQRQKLIDLGFFLQKAGKHADALKYLKPHVTEKVTALLNYSDSLFALEHIYSRAQAYHFYRYYAELVAPNSVPGWVKTRIDNLREELRTKHEPQYKKIGTRRVESYSSYRVVPIDAIRLVDITDSTLVFETSRPIKVSEDSWNTGTCPAETVKLCVFSEW